MFGYTSIRGIGEFRNSGTNTYEKNREAAKQTTIGSNERSIRWLETNMARTLLICETLWELLRDEHGWTDDMLTKKIEEIDLRDGNLDGKNQQKTSRCPSCGKVVSPRYKACIYCGRAVEKSVFTM